MSLMIKIPADRAGVVAARYQGLGESETAAEAANQVCTSIGTKSMTQ